MSVSGVLENLIATAMWVVLVWVTIRIRKRLLAEDENDEIIFKTCKQIIPETTDLGDAQDLTMGIIVIINRYQRQLNSQIRGAVVSIIFILWYWYNVVHATKNPSITGYDIFIVSLLYLALIGFDFYQIRRMRIRIDKFEDCVLEGLTEKAKRTQKRSDHSELKED